MNAATPHPVRRLVKLALCAALYYSGLIALIARWLPRRRPVILCAHRVTSKHDPFFPGIPRDRFAAEVAYLARHHRVLPLTEIVDARPNGRPLPRGAVAITFDDGAADNFELAYPILRKYGVPATIFVVSDSMEHGRLPWPERLVYLVRHTTRAQLELRGLQPHVLPLGTQAERLAALDTLLPLLKTSSTETRRRAMDELETALAVGPDRGMMLSWPQCRRMAADGIEFGSHTLSHPVLPRTETLEVKREIVESRSAIEAQLGRPVRHFAYPNDESCDAAVEALQAAGFEAAFAGTAHLHDAPIDPFRIGRTAWDPGPVCVFAADVSGILEAIAWLVSRRR